MLKSSNDRETKEKYLLKFILKFIILELTINTGDAGMIFYRL